MNKITAFLLILLSGCSGCGQSATPTSFDFVGASGTRVVYDQDVIRNDPAIYERAFIKARQCLYDNSFIPTPDIEGPIIHVVNYRVSVQGIYTDGMVEPTGLMTINLQGPITHEMIHYLLLKAGAPDWNTHTSAAFMKCDGITPIVTVPIG